MECQPTPPLDQMSSSSSEDNNKEASSDSSDEEKEKEAKEEEQETSTLKLSPYHAKNYFNSTMEGKDLQVLCAIAVSCNTHELPDPRTHHFPRQMHTILKSDLMQQH